MDDEKLICPITRKECLETDCMWYNFYDTYGDPDKPDRGGYYCTMAIIPHMLADIRDAILMVVEK